MEHVKYIRQTMPEVKQKVTIFYYWYYYYYYYYYDFDHVLTLYICFLISDLSYFISNLSCHCCCYYFFMLLSLVIIIIILSLPIIINFVLVFLLLFSRTCFPSCLLSCIMIIQGKHYKTKKANETINKQTGTNNKPIRIDNEGNCDNRNNLKAMTKLLLYYYYYIIIIVAVIVT